VGPAHMENEQLRELAVYVTWLLHRVFFW